MPFPVHAVSIWTYCMKKCTSNRRVYHEAAITSFNFKRQTIRVSFLIWQTMRIGSALNIKYDFFFSLFRDGKMQTITVFMKNGTQINCILSASFQNHLGAKYYSSKVMLTIFFDYCQKSCPKVPKSCLKVHTLVMLVSSRPHGANENISILTSRNNS